jgi:hypothetical protein
VEESDFWARLEHRICDEFAGFERAQDVPVERPKRAADRPDRVELSGFCSTQSNSATSGAPTSSPPRRVSTAKAPWVERMGRDRGLRPRRPVRQCGSHLGHPKPRHSA